MPVTNSIIGARYGRLVVLKELPPKVSASGASIAVIVLCQCDCGTQKALRLNNLMAKLTTSCGCYRKEVTSKRKTRHGHRAGSFKRNPSPVYRVWHAMIQRCTNPNNKSFEDYGARGITVCERWHKFENFLADMGEPPEGMSIEREDNSKGYESGNCSWKPRAIQNLNKRNVAKLTFDGKTLTAPEWSEVTGIPKKTITGRIRLGWSVEKALTIPVDRPSPIAAGARFGKWTVIREVDPDKPGRRYFHCRCDCGTERDVYARSLMIGMSTSCGCSRRDKTV